jgi:hypothetical protein
LLSSQLFCQQESRRPYSIPLLPGSYASRLASRNTTLFYPETASFCTLLHKHLARTTQKTQPLCCWEGVFTAPLYSNESYSSVACVFIAAGVCLQSRCLTINL